MLRILIVDDSPTEMHIITKMLKSHGHQCISAEDGAQGVELAKKEKPDLILMDVVMPVLNGFKATRALSKAPETTGIPVIILSNKSTPTDKMWGEKQGAKDYLFKPIDESQLINTINGLVA